MVKPSLGKTCIVPDCLSVYYPGCGVRFHRFPRNVAKRNIWLRRLNISPKSYHDGATVCYLHFSSSDYVQSRNSLKNTAVPHAASKHLDYNSDSDLERADEEKVPEEFKEVSSPSKHDLDSDNDSDYILGISSTNNEGEKVRKDKKKKVSHTKQVAGKFDEKIEKTKYDTAIKNDESDETQVVTKVCRICLITDCKMFSISQLNLEQTYLLLTGFTERMFEDTKMPQMLCYECLKGVQNFIELSTKSVTASSILMELIEENKLNMESIKSVDRSGNMLTSKLGVSVFEANSFNVQIDEYEDDTFVNNDDTFDNNDDTFDNNDDTFDNNDGTFDNNDECASKENIYSNHVDDEDPIEICISLDDSSESFSVKDDDSIHKVEIHENSVKTAKKSSEIEYTSEIEKSSDDESEDELASGAKEKPESKGRKISEFKKVFIVRSMTNEDKIADFESRKNSDMYKNAKYKCNLCYRAFIHEPPYKEHMKKHTHECGKFVCDLCKLHFRTKTILGKHIRARHDQFIQCRLCPFKSTDKRTATVHKYFHDERRYQCPHCPRSYVKANSYTNHLSWRHPQDAICHLCGESLVGMRSLEKHVRSAHEGEDFLIKAPSSKSKTVFGLKSILKKEVPGTRYTVTKFITTLPAGSPYCDVCEVRFRNRAALRTHKAVSPIHGNPPKKPPQRRKKHVGTVTCEQCGVECANIRAYRSHFAGAHPGLTRMQYSNALPTYMCELCGRIFQNKTVLTEHVRTHNGERPYACTKCTSTYATKNALQTHVRDKHTSCFRCSQCGKVSASAKGLKRHMLLHTGKPFSCDSCDKRFSSPSEKRGHILHEHMGVPWPKKRAKTDPGYKKRSKPRNNDDASE